MARRFGALPGFSERPWFWVALGAGALLLFRAGGAVVATLKNAATSAEWAKGLWDVLAAQLPDLPPAGRLIAVAHAAYESGWGKTNQAKTANNFWNITAGPAWKGAVMKVANADLSYAASDCAAQGRTMTMQPNGRMACRVDQVWRSYPSVNAAVSDYWSFLGGRYAAARAAMVAGDVVAFSKALAARGYYTLPEAQYTSTLQAVVNTARGFLVV